MNNIKRTEPEAQIALDAARKEIDGIDAKISEIFNKVLGPELLKRFEITNKIGEIKKEQNWPIHVPERETKLLEKIENSIDHMSIKAFAKSFYNIILSVSKEQQEK